ncbi:MAG: hemerythrin domain-containing protein [Thermoplasmata archaeon YP2-bin.285]|uniref:Hemerythrin domain-containing protein n=2 Tax=Candidatus Sysuiplasma superficiale TaxID=2823368 RepID=A0A8J8CBI3_9ARCH|nr:hemerythrin domain-containing protein [Candidatus Sysuiplasma superficiale]
MIVSEEKMKDEHRKMEADLRELRNRISDGGDVLGLLSELEERLKNHIYVEEEILFPSLTDEEENRIARGFEYEHAAILTLVDKIHRGISEGDMALALKKTESTLRLFSQHSRREEMTAYRSWTERTAGSGAKTERSFAGSLPKDWKCRFFRDRGA